MKAKILPVICMAALLTGCAGGTSEPVLQGGTSEAVSQSDAYSASVSDIHRVDSGEASAEAEQRVFVFPPKGEKTVDTTFMPTSTKEFETGEIVPDGWNPAHSFMLDGIRYIENGYGEDFVADTDGSILAYGNCGLLRYWITPDKSPEYDGYDVIEPFYVDFDVLRDYENWQYIGTTENEGHLFRYGDLIIACKQLGDEWGGPALLFEMDFDPGLNYSITYYVKFDDNIPYGSYDSRLPENIPRVYNKRTGGVTELTSLVFPPEGGKLLKTTPENTLANGSETGEAAGIVLDGKQYTDLSVSFNFAVDTDGTVLLACDDGLMKYWVSLETVSSPKGDTDAEIGSVLKAIEDWEYLGVSENEGHLFRCGNLLIGCKNIGEAGISPAAILDDLDFDLNLCYEACLYAPEGLDASSELYDFFLPREKPKRNNTTT